MTNTSQNNSNEIRVKPIHKLLISLFAALTMTIQILSYAYEVNLTKGLFQEYSSLYPEESKTFQWALESSASFSLIEIVTFGIITGVVIYAIVHFSVDFFKKEKWDGRQSIGNMGIMFAYLGLFSIFSYIIDPISLQRPLNWVWGIAFAIVCGTTTHLLLIHDRLRRNRFVDTSKFDEKSHKWNFLGQSYQMELSEYQNILGALIAFSVTLVAGLGFSSVLQVVFSLPTGITFSNQFGSVTITIIAKLFVLSLGLILGVIYQLMFEIHTIRNCIHNLCQEPRL